MFRKFVLIFALLLSSAALLSSCTVIDGDIYIPERPSQIPVGEVWADLNGMFYRFQSPGAVQPLDANAYSKDLRFVSVYREINYGYGNFLIRITNFDLEGQSLFPVELKQSFRISYSPKPNDNYIATEADGAKLTIESFTGQTIKGTFSGTIKNALGQTLRVTNGQFHIQLNRY
jgi:hypothetical protein